MDHDDVLEQLELAAVEPGGLDRLVAGDTPTAAAVVTHLAGCERCAEELRRLGRAAPLLRDVVRTTPSPDLRERTLAYVREHGRPRAAEIGSSPVPTMGSRTAETVAGSRMRRILPWVATIAAVIALSVSTAGLLAYRDVADRMTAQTTTIAALERVQRATLELTGEAGSKRIELAAANGGDTSGTLLFSPSTTELVVVAYDLARPPSGQEYRCWVAIDGQRHDVGRMFFADELAFWVGKTPEVSRLPAGSQFGVSATPVGSPSLEADPVISGTL
jgi:hypothetical protein